MIATIAKCLVAAGKGSCYTDADLGLLYLCRRYAERNVKNYLRAGVELATYTDVLPPHGIVSDDPDMLRFEKAGGQMVGYSWRRSGYADPKALVLAEVPVRAVTAVYETYTPGGGLNPPSSALLDPANYVVDFDTPPDPTNNNYGVSLSGVVWKYYSIWPAVVRSIAVTYTAGWTPTELRDKYPEIEEAVLMTVVKGYRTWRAYQDQELGLGGVGPITNVAVQGVSRSYDVATVRAVLGQACSLTAEVKDLLAIHVNYSRRI